MRKPRKPEHRFDPPPPLYYGHSPSVAEAIQEVIVQEGSRAAAARALETTVYRMKLWMTGKATPQKRTTWERIGQAKEAIILRQRGGEQVPLPCHRCLGRTIRLSPSTFGAPLSSESQLGKPS